MLVEADAAGRHARGKEQLLGGLVLGGSRVVVNVGREGGVAAHALYKTCDGVNREIASRIPPRGGGATDPPPRRRGRGYGLVTAETEDPRWASGSGRGGGRGIAPHSHRVRENPWCHSVHRDSWVAARPERQCNAQKIR